MPVPQRTSTVLRRGAFGLLVGGATLDPDTLTRLWDEGGAMPLDQAIAYALQHL